MGMLSTKGETEILNLKPHWSILISPVFLIIVGFILLLFVMGWGVFCILVGGALLLLKLIAMNTNYLRLTNKRVYIKNGLLKKEEMDIRLDKLDGVNVVLPFFDRLLGCGDIAIRSTGSSKISFGPVEDPDRIRQAIADAADGLM